MGARYLLEVTCPNEKCGLKEEDVYFAPTCGFTSWKCPDCGTVVDLEEMTGITAKAASNREDIREVMNKIAGV